MRIVRTVLRGWKKYKNHPNARIRARFAHEASNLPVRYAGVLWAIRRYYRDNARWAVEIGELLSELHRECGWRSRLAAPIVGRYLYRMLQRQERLLKDGWTCEPPTFYETNAANGPETAERVEGIFPKSEHIGASSGSVVQNGGDVQELSTV